MITTVRRALSAGEREELAGLLVRPKEEPGDRGVKRWMIFGLLMVWFGLTTVAILVGWLVSERAVLPCVVGWWLMLPLLWGLYRLLGRSSQAKLRRSVERCLNASVVELQRIECRAVVELYGAEGKVLKTVLDLGEGKLMLFHPGKLRPWPVRCMELLTWDELHQESGKIRAVDIGGRMYPLLVAAGPIVAAVRVRVDMEMESVENIFESFLGGAFHGLEETTFAGSVETILEDLKRHSANVKVRKGSGFSVVTQGKRN